MTQPNLTCIDDLNSACSAISPWDAVILVSSHIAETGIEAIDRALHQASSTDMSLGKETQLLIEPDLAGGRLILAPTGPLDRDFDDVRRFADAAGSGILRAKRAGAKAPIILVRGVPHHLAFAHAHEVSVLGALQALWQPLEAREDLGDDTSEPIARIAIEAPENGEPDVFCDWLWAVESGRRVTRDVAGANPERMSPPNMATYCEALFSDSCIQLEIIADVETIAQQYPLAYAVSRASLAVPRHHPRIVRMKYVADGIINHSYFLAGKGLSYDTGGADLKVGGHMAGMSRDKGGGAAVIGFMKFLNEVRPPGIQVIAEVGCVRNSVGADSFVSDEIIRSHAGVRVRIGNTDAEGRLVLADLLSHLRTQTVEAPNAHIMSIATLTGHSGRAAGPYTIAMDNGPACDAGFSARLSEIGDLWGDPFEISRLRREDWAFVAPRSAADDVLSANNLPSTATDRGHQYPMAFLSRASGLDQHGRTSGVPIPYTHIDIGGSAYESGDWQHGRPTAAPLTALIAALLRA